MSTSVASLQIDRYKILQALLVSSCLILFLCFFTPLDIFLNNTKEFDYLFNEIYLYLLLGCVSLIALLTLILILIPKSIFERVLSLFLVITVLLWVQGNLFNKDYGPLDGGKINWDKWSTSGYVEAGIWSILIILTIIFSPFIKRIVNKVCVVILLTLICTFAIKYFQYSPLDERQVIFDESIKFDFSSDKNVILIVVDEVQSDVFYEIISKHPEFKEQFSGFVYYPDAVAGYPYTKTSVPNILTGKYYDNSAPFREYIEKAYLGNSIPRVLKQNKFQVDLIPTYYDDTILKSNTIASNLIKKGQIANFRQGLSNSLHLVDIALFRNVPHLLKSHIIDDNKWFLSELFPPIKSKLSHLNWLSGDVNFYGEISNINDSVRQPVFKFFHLKGCHAPYNKNASGNHVPSTRTREAYKNFVIYNLKRLVLFLDQLKSKGIYDKSLIYIFGDHGAGRYEELKVNTELIENNGYIKRSTIPIKIKARAIPLFMTKSFSSTGELKISSKPVALADIPQMIFEDLGIKSDQQALGSSNSESASERIRRYLYWKFPHNDPMYEYRIEGNGWFDSSWNGPNGVYTMHGVYDKYFSAIFEKSNSNNFRLESSVPEEGYQFQSSGKGSYSITIKKRNQRSNYFLSLVLDTDIELDDLEIDVYANHKRIKTIKVEESSHISRSPIFGVPVPSRYSRKRDLNIDISYRGKSSSKIENPFEAIYVFKLQKS